MTFYTIPVTVVNQDYVEVGVMLDTVLIKLNLDK